MNALVFVTLLAAEAGFALLQPPPVGTALATAGLVAGDTIVSVDGCLVTGPTDFANALRATQTGEHVVELRRSGDTLLARTGGTQTAPAKPAAGWTRAACAPVAAKDTLVPAYRKGAFVGVKLISLATSSPLARSGLLAGDVVTRVGGCALTKERPALLDRVAERKGKTTAVLVEGTRKTETFAFVSSALDAPPVARTDLPAVVGDRPECAAFLADQP